jgi:hypothetical protein
LLISQHDDSKELSQLLDITTRLREENSNLITLINKMNKTLPSAVIDEWRLIPQAMRMSNSNDDGFTPSHSRRPSALTSSLAADRRAVSFEPAIPESAELTVDLVGNETPPRTPQPPQQSPPHKRVISRGEFSHFNLSPADGDDSLTTTSGLTKSGHVRPQPLDATTSYLNDYVDGYQSRLEEVPQPLTSSLGSNGSNNNGYRPPHPSLLHSQSANILSAVGMDDDSLMMVEESVVEEPLPPVTPRTIIRGELTDRTMTPPPANYPRPSLTSTRTAPTEAQTMNAIDYDGGMEAVMEGNATPPESPAIPPRKPGFVATPMDLLHQSIGSNNGGMVAPSAGPRRTATVADSAISVQVISGDPSDASVLSGQTPPGSPMLPIVIGGGSQLNSPVTSPAKRVPINGTGVPPAFLLGRSDSGDSDLITLEDLQQGGGAPTVGESKKPIGSPTYRLPPAAGATTTAAAGGPTPPRMGRLPAASPTGARGVAHAAATAGIRRTTTQTTSSSSTTHHQQHTTHSSSSSTSSSHGTRGGNARAATYSVILTCPYPGRYRMDVAFYPDHMSGTYGAGVALASAANGPVRHQLALPPLPTSPSTAAPHRGGDGKRSGPLSSSSSTQTASVQATAVTLERGTQTLTRHEDLCRDSDSDDDHNDDDNNDDNDDGKGSVDDIDDPTSTTVSRGQDQVRHQMGRLMALITSSVIRSVKKPMGDPQGGILTVDSVHAHDIVQVIFLFSLSLVMFIACIAQLCVFIVLPTCQSSNNQTIGQDYYSSWHQS